MNWCLYLKSTLASNGSEGCFIVEIPAPPLQQWSAPLENDLAIQL